MNKDELKDKFEVAALGCLDTYQYYKFLQSLDDELKEEFGKYQKIASIIPFSLQIEQPAPEIKKRVVLGIKKIIQERTKQTTSKNLTEEKAPPSIEQRVYDERVFESDNQISAKSVEDKIPLNNEIINESVKSFDSNNFQTDTDEVLLSDDNSLSETKTQFNSNSLKEPEVKISVDYGPKLKEEIAEEITKRVKKTIQIQFEDFEIKTRSKNRSIKILLTIILLLLLLLTAFNIYQSFFQ